MAWPMPRPAPVTRATLSINRWSIVSRHTIDGVAMLLGARFNDKVAVNLRTARGPVNPLNRGDGIG